VCFEPRLEDPALRLMAKAMTLHANSSGERRGRCMCASGSPFQKMSGPSKSMAGLAPTCSTRRRQFEPSM